MKRLFFAATVALLLAVPAVKAQKVDRDAFMQKIEKSDADIADAKKTTKVATWMNRGKIYYEAAVEPTKNIFIGMEEAMLQLALGAPQSTAAVTIEATGAIYNTYVYNWLTAYLKDGKVISWKETDQIYPDAIKVALAAYAKAYEMDASQASRLKDGLEQINNFCSQEGNVNIDIAEYKRAAKAYMTAYEAQMQPAYLAAGGKANPALLYYAGNLLTLDGAKDPQSFVKGAELLDKALATNYTDEEGNIYYYLFHCYYGQAATAEGEAKAAFLQQAKKALTDGIAKFPNNQRIIEGFMTLYTREKGVGDPSELVSLIKQAIDRDPKSVDMWSSLGLVYYTLKDYDNAIVVGEKVANELAPDVYDGIYRLGVYHAAKGDAIREAMSSKEYTSQADYDTDLKNSNKAYAAAFPWLDKAYKLQPSNKPLVETLKQICFSLRDESPAMMEKYKEYNAIFQKMQ
ncbi:MAG: hypothetical protein RR330_04230 [Alistipes sp.]